ncbi:MAG: pyrroloquinoline quinone biosynthesis protein PqqE, partial [Pseudonocardiaceae bacterium]|nr:pyrroloquinoline quinone biosynthesis protein PqqE [Pseudonocardiaceae bacterium]
DPVCHLSPDHALVTDAVQVANEEARSDAEILVPRPHRA